MSLQEVVTLIIRSERILINVDDFLIETTPEFLRSAIKDFNDEEDDGIFPDMYMNENNILIVNG